MSMHLVEGESFPQDYNLDKKLTDSGDQSVWLATNRQTGDRVVVRAFLTPIEDNEWQSLVSRVENLKGLLHEGITSVRTASTDAGIQYLLEPYIPGAQPFIPDAKSLWPSIHSLLDALAFAHNLGIPHGNLHSGNLLITPDSKTHITGFGVPGHASIPNEWQSPQIKAGNPAAVSDDIYSIGCLLFKAFTGSEWSDLSLAKGELDQPLPAELESLVKSMIAESPFNRPTDIDSVLDTLASYFARPDDSIESIDFARPEQVSPVDSDIPSIETRHKPSIPAGVAFGALAFIIAAASLLFLLLPTEPAEISEIQQQVVPAQASTTPGSSTSQGAPTKGPSPYRAAELAFFKEESERLTREILRYQLDLEDQGARLWAGDNLNSIDTAVQSAEQAFRDEDYSAALEQYQSIHQSLAALVEQIPAQLEFEVSRGEQALNDGDSRTAIEAFTIALAIEKRADILNNLDRAEQLEEVMSLVRKAEMFERDGELDEALSSFQSAYSMDGQWGPAIEGVARVEASIQSRQFRQAMSEAFQAIAGKDYDGARSALHQAQSISPSSSEPEDGLLQVEQAEKNDAIERYRIQAEASLTDDRWQEAIDSYQAALEISPSLEFAVQGLRVAKDRLRMEDDFQRLLTDPTLLQANEELKSASTLLRDASRIDNPSSETIRYIDTLARLVSTARQEIPVTIRSDGKTIVTVRKHAVLGEINTETVYLIPGRYTITGERSGYRNVHEEIILVAGRPVPTIEIMSDEQVP